MRTGKILSYNSKAGVGLIQDTNNQRVKFYIEDCKTRPFGGNEVYFTISFRNGGLIAGNIRMFKFARAQN